ncbi:MAG: biopolymer transporter ExbD [Chitinophagaceae bacterium]|nr:biopolymer transporter ExbD [Chitinophagaceae bacterium]
MGADVSAPDSGGGKKGPGVKKQARKDTKVDMTPMVDLGFLLITFFVFTTTMSTPKAFKLNVPDDSAKDEEKNEAKASGAFTVLLGKQDHVYYYEGQLLPDGSNFKSSNFKAIRNEILKKKANTPEKDLVVIIKPNEESNYKNVVDMLDEMQIAVIKKYAIVDISEGENALIKITEGGSVPPSGGK